MGEEPDLGAITEDLLTGGRALRAAFLSTPLTHASGGTSIIRFDERDAPVFLIRRGVAYRSCELANSKRAIVDVLIPGDIAGLDHVLVSRSVGEFTAAGPLSFNALSASTVRELRVRPSLRPRVVHLGVRKTSPTGTGYVGCARRDRAAARPLGS
jgi:hypothetical protein